MNPIFLLVTLVLATSCKMRSSENAKIASSEDPASARPLEEDNASKKNMHFEFVKISSGSFLMGSPQDEVGRQPEEIQHRVSLTKDFLIQTTEVTQMLWFEVMGNNPSRFNSAEDCPSQFQQISGTSLCPENPVEEVSWVDVQKFIQKLNDRNDGFTYRLPTESEWEYAARAGTKGPYSTNGEIKTFAWLADTSPDRTQPVGKLKPNPWGLYDMHGNVEEWTADWYGDYSTADATDPVGPLEGQNVLVTRGGDFFASAEYHYSRSASRGYQNGVYSKWNIGFRLVRTLQGNPPMPCPACDYYTELFRKRKGS